MKKSRQKPSKKSTTPKQNPAQPTLKKTQVEEPPDPEETQLPPLQPHPGW